MTDTAHQTDHFTQVRSARSHNSLSKCNLIEVQQTSQIHLILHFPFLDRARRSTSNVSFT